ncbi:MAG: hypothetical protein AB7L66_00175 [Gemmatimonadales bacterium]
MKRLTLLGLLLLLSTPAAAQGRDEEFYYPGSFNWRFRRAYPEAAKLFNAFDYGHAVLYEVLYSGAADPVARLEGKELRFLTEDLLSHPPSFAVPEEAVMPAYARAAWRAKLMFDRAHVLHRQIYDAYADDRLSPEQAAALVERLTDHYLADRRYAFTDRPKDMGLMDDQYYSQVFRREFPAFNGLIWAYHWLQVGLYEPLVTESGEAKREAVAETVRRFRQLIATTPGSAPSVMPMTPAVAPVFSQRHPRAAAIFDNLHMMHDIISDVLASPKVAPADRIRVINDALDEFQRSDRMVMDPAHWRMMADHMGGVDKMGGVAGRHPPR